MNLGLSVFGFDIFKIETQPKEKEEQPVLSYRDLTKAIPLTDLQYDNTYAKSRINRALTSIDLCLSAQGTYAMNRKHKTAVKIISLKIDRLRTVGDITHLDASDITCIDGLSYGSLEHLIKAIDKIGGEVPNDWIVTVRAHKND